MIFTHPAIAAAAIRAAIIADDLFAVCAPTFEAAFPKAHLGVARVAINRSKKALPATKPPATCALDGTWPQHAVGSCRGIVTLVCHITVSTDPGLTFFVDRTRSATAYFSVTMLLAHATLLCR